MKMIEDKKEPEVVEPTDGVDSSANAAVELSVEPLLATVAETRQLLRIGKTQVFQLLRDDVLERRKVSGSTRITMRSIRKLAGL